MNHKDAIDDGVLFPFFIANVFSDCGTIAVQYSGYLGLISICLKEHVRNGFYGERHAASLLLFRRSLSFC
ncbi:hypothetical protein ECDEC11C_5978 [Escherichia coli DEC11C]|nr:hypothetical protein ECDEC11C_5978 [Escherichia coli DEC11C]